MLYSLLLTYTFWTFIHQNGSKLSQQSYTICKISIKYNEYDKVTNLLVNLVIFHLSSHEWMLYLFDQDPKFNIGLQICQIYIIYYAANTWKIPTLLSNYEGKHEMAKHTVILVLPQWPQIRSAYKVWSPYICSFVLHRTSKSQCYNMYKAAVAVLGADCIWLKSQVKVTTIPLIFWSWYICWLVC